MSQEYIITGDSFQISLLEDSVELTDLAAAVFETGDMTSVDLTNYTEVRFAALVSVAGTTGRMKLQYSLDDSVWTDLTTNFVSLAGTGSVQSDWEAIPALALGCILVRAVGYNGDASEDPTIAAVAAHFRR